jgi:hypothetical protein
MAMFRLLGSCAGEVLRAILEPCRQLVATPANGKLLSARTCRIDIYADSPRGWRLDCWYLWLARARNSAIARFEAGPLSLFGSSLAPPRRPAYSLARPVPAAGCLKPLTADTQFRSVEQGSG